MENYNEKIAILLKKVGVTPANQGWKYLTEAVKMVLEDDTVIDGITKRLYPEIAEKFKTTSSAVERGIRCSINRAFYNMPSKMVKYIFGNTLNKNGTATNGEFIATLAELVTFEPNNPIWSM
jgi:two-component system response regulator (stage 0 sporulation protein A)